MYEHSDTIAAISTPPGSGGIAIIRVSGAAAVEIVSQHFTGKKPLKDSKSRSVCLGKFYSTAAAINCGTREVLDEVLVVKYGSPKSYTGEDVVEINCHGGSYLSGSILQAVLNSGARLARPGEFTQRAFLNGRMDLSQAEAVADIINSKTARSLSNAMAQFQGALSERVRIIRKELIDICSLLELELDFAEEDIKFAGVDEVIKRVKAVQSKVAAFLATFNRGKILREGARLVIVGAPNVGKSSLLNALLKEDRAIVTEIAGTTRDPIEEQLDVRGIFFRVVDTAGVRPTNETVEKLGVERTYQQIEEADVLLILFDSSRHLHKEDRRLVSEVRRVRAKYTNSCIAVLNKCDLEQQLLEKDIKALIGPGTVIEVSALRHEGIQELEKALVETVKIALVRDHSIPAITNLRQKNALERGLKSLQLTLDSLKKGLSGEFVVIDLHQAIQCLGEIIGEITTEDILENIFSKFCLGK